MLWGLEKKAGFWLPFSDLLGCCCLWEFLIQFIVGFWEEDKHGEGAISAIQLILGYITVP